MEENDINMVLSEILESKTGLKNSEDIQAEDENEMDEETSDATEPEVTAAPEPTASTAPALEKKTDGVLSYLPTAPALSDAEAEKAARHAPNIYVDWAGSGTYDIISVDWCCVKEAKNTYWAVHNWPGGYAGFLNADGSQVLLMSVWDGDDGGKPTIEYVLGGQNGDFGDFGDEETDKQVYTNYI